jgi:hypothetical protein
MRCHTGTLGLIVRGRRRRGDATTSKRQAAARAAEQYIFKCARSLKFSLQVNRDFHAYAGS